MAELYHTKHFFRQISNALLARYFHKKGLFREFDFQSIEDGDIESLFDAWMKLEISIRSPIDTELSEIFDLSCEKGWKSILDEAKEQFSNKQKSYEEFLKSFSDLPNHYDRAMKTFLDHHELWEGATLFHLVDQLSYWRRRNNMQHKQAAKDQKNLNELADMIRCYFHHNEGRGRNCVVEHCRRQELDYFFCYPEDYSQQSAEWVEGKMGHRPHNPAFKIFYVYSQKDGTLDLNFRGNRKAIEPLQTMFAQVILNLSELPPDPEDLRVYDLTPLLDRNFRFITAPGSGVEDVVIKKMRFLARGIKGERVSIEADEKEHPGAFYDVLDRLAPLMPLRGFTLNQVELSAKVVITPYSPPKTVLIRLTHPNSCNLKYDEIGLRLRGMLEESGIVLKMKKIERIRS